MLVHSASLIDRFYCITTIFEWLMLLLKLILTVFMEFYSRSLTAEMQIHDVGLCLILLVPYFIMTVRYFKSTNYSFLNRNVRQTRNVRPL